MDYPSLFQMFREVSTINGSKLAFKHKRDGNWFDVTWVEARETVQRVAKSLIALDVSKGARISILSQTRLEWVLCDFGIVSCGAVTVGIYPSNLAEGCAYILAHSDSEIVFVENAEQLGKVLGEAGMGDWHVAHAPSLQAGRAGVAVLSRETSPAGVRTALPGIDPESVADSGRWIETGELPAAKLGAQWRIRPRVGRTSPHSIVNRVDLPEPFGPVSVRI